LGKALSAFKFFTSSAVKKNPLSPASVASVTAAFAAASFLPSLSNNSFLLAIPDSLVIPLYIENLGSSILPKSSLNTLLPWPITCDICWSPISLVTICLKNFLEVTSSAVGVKLTYLKKGNWPGVLSFKAFFNTLLTNVSASASVNTFFAGSKFGLFLFANL